MPIARCCSSSTTRMCFASVEVAIVNPPSLKPTSTRLCQSIAHRIRADCRGTTSRPGSSTSNTLPGCAPRLRTLILPRMRLTSVRTMNSPSPVPVFDRSSSLPMRKKRPKIFCRKLIGDAGPVVDDPRDHRASAGHPRLHDHLGLLAGVLDRVVDQIAKHDFDVHRLGAAPRPAVSSSLIVSSAAGSAGKPSLRSCAARRTVRRPPSRRSAGPG